MDQIEIKTFQQKDLNQARRFAVEGMHLGRYVNNRLELYLYSKYVIYVEFLKSTTVIGAYSKGRLVGFLFSRFDDEQTASAPWTYKAYCNLFSKLVHLVAYNNADTLYHDTNCDLLAHFMHNDPEGEITFFAVDPSLKGKGIGSLLLNELIRTHKNKLVYLYTDSASTYQFYAHRGFQQSGKKEINIPLGRSKHVPLTCFLFSRTL